MQITETLSQGLKREFSIVVAKADLASKFDQQLASIAPQVRMPGFRPGKVPMNLVRKMHGKAIHGQMVEETINETSQKLMADKGIRPAMQPKIDLVSFAEGQDLEYTISVEVLPEVPAVSLDGLALEKLVIPVAEADVDAAVERLAGQQKAFDDAAADHAAQAGDAVVIDFLGKVDGVAFEGGKGEAVQVELGSGMLIPGFEDQLVGAKAGDERLVSVSFPEEYPVATLKGRAATFDVTVKEVKTPKTVAIDDALATNLGLESLAQLKELLKAQIEREYGGLTRTHMKRKLLDALAAAHSFEVPAGMVDVEFSQIWDQLEREIGDNAEEKAKLEAEKDDYRAIAERRVRLGLLLSDVGQKANVQISQAEMNQLIAREAQRYPNQQKEVVKFFQENAAAAAQLRAPLYEEKVVDYILGQITLTEREVTREALEAAIQDDDTTPTGATPAEDKPKKAAPKPKKAKADEAAAEAPAAEAEAAPKPKKAPKKKAAGDADAG
jgi:trigger factor